MNKTTSRKRATGLLVALGAGIALLGLDAARASVVGLERVSVSSSGVEANNTSAVSDISADGNLIAFYSAADNLVPGDTNGTTDIFVHDRTSGETTRVSVATGGGQANGLSLDPAISADGRFVAFRSEATNLVPGLAEGIYVHDRQSGVTEKVDRNSLEEPGNGIDPSISADGRFVSFSAIGLPGDVGVLDFQVYVRDRVAGTTVRASNGPAGAFANIHCFESALSGNGQFVTFSTGATNLVANDTNGSNDIFVVNLANGATERADLGPGGAQGNTSGGSFTPDIDASGRFVTFATNHPNLVPDDTNNHIDVFVRDRQAGVTTRVSVSTTGGQTTLGNVMPDISGNGRFVLFSSVTDELVPGDANLKSDILLRDLQTGQLEIVSSTPAGQQGNGDSSFARLNHDGSAVVFRSDADNLVANDTNLSADIFVVEVQNRAPVASAGADQGLAIPHDGNPKTNTIGVDLSGAASTDPDGDPLTFEWRNAGGTVLGTTAALSLNLSAGDHILTLKVTDPDGVSAEDTVLVTVAAEPNGAPVADAGKNRTLKSKKKKVTVRLNGRDSTDPDKDKLTFSWKKGATELATGATPSVKLTKGKHRITLTTTDPYGATDTDVVVITVKRQ